MFSKARWVPLVGFEPKAEGAPRADVFRFTPERLTSQLAISGVQEMPDFIGFL
jgi:hypothetical protein